MEKVHIFDLEGTRFPAGRRTRVVIGQNGAITGDKFCQGYVVIDRTAKFPSTSTKRSNPTRSSKARVG